MDPLAAISSIIGSVLGGGSNAIIAILILLVGVFALVIRHLLGEIQNHRAQVVSANERYLKLLEEYHKSNTVVTSALHDLQIVLIEIRAKL